MTATAHQETLWRRKTNIFSQFFGFDQHTSGDLIDSPLRCAAVGIHLEYGSKLAVSIRIRRRNQMTPQRGGACAGQVWFAESGQLFCIAVGIGAGEIIILGELSGLRDCGFA